MKQHEVDLLKAHARGEHVTLEQIEAEIMSNEPRSAGTAWFFRLVNDCPRCDKLRPRASVSI